MSERPDHGDPADGDPTVGGGSARPGVAGRGSVFHPTQPSPLRTFLTSNTGGGLVALASVLLVVAVLLAVRATPAGIRDTASGAFGRGHPAVSGTGALPAPGTPSAPESGSTSGSASGVGGPAGTPSVRPTAAPTPRPHRLATDHLPLTVLNNTVVHGLAHRAADTFAASGWTVAMVGNYAGMVPTTTVYFTAGNAAEQRAAEALARDFPKITRVLPHDPHLPVSARGVIVVIAPDWLT